MSKVKKHARDNRANQLNPNNFAYYQSRGILNNDAPRIGGSGEPIQSEAQLKRSQKKSTNSNIVRTTDGTPASNLYQRRCRLEQR